MTDNSQTTPEKLLPGEDDVHAWVHKMSENMTPDDWANEALASACVKKTKRQFLAPHISDKIRDAQEAAVRRALREALNA